MSPTDPAHALPGVRERIEGAHALGELIHVRWWNRHYGPGRVTSVDDEGFHLLQHPDDDFPDPVFCGWHGVVAVTQTYAELPDDKAWKRHWPDPRDELAALRVSPTLPAIRAVLAAYRSTGAHITEEQITAAWSEYEAARAALTDRGR